MKLSGSRIAAVVVALCIVLLDPATAEAAKKRRKKTRRPRAAPVRVETPVGATFEERLSSLINGATSRAADASIQVVEIDNGRVIAERNAHLPLAPASNMKL